MRRELKRELVVFATSLMARHLPMFQPIDARGAETGPMFAYAAGTGFTFFINIYASQKRDAFTVELAWSESGEWPTDSGNVPRDWAELRLVKTPPKDGKYRFRLTKLWLVPKMDPWWEITPRASVAEILRRDPRDLGYLEEMDIAEAVERLRNLLADAIAKTVEYGIPYFRNVANERGIAWPSGDQPERASPPRSTP
jgi:hypothetical protein